MKTGVQRETSWVMESDRVSAEIEHLCLNCGEPLHGAFCSNCGQRAVPPRPSLRELLGEAFAEFSGWDGKLAATLRLLVTRPGQLTVDFLDGKRARYITPLRLYLSVSLVYFLLSAAAPSSIAPGELAKVGDVGNAKITVGLGSHTPDQLTADQREVILASVPSAPKPLRPALRRLGTDPQGFQKDFTEVMPRLMFALLPVFALIVALFYRGRGFVEHLYFTIHVQTFFFVALGIGVLSRFTHVMALIIAAGILQFIWAPLYAHFSLRRVYGGSNGSTLLKELGIGALYAAVYVPSVVSLAVWIGGR
ncbi:MAG TPA: DUF3667 domain-containing protein [Gemmatimonadaceae bacterium]|jgi:hypothetical protein|nr:DUF3667 domain-containing protein [Gemmatimonadaceae bacterium]